MPDINAILKKIQLGLVILPMAAAPLVYSGCGYTSCDGDGATNEPVELTAEDAALQSAPDVELFLGCPVNTSDGWALDEAKTHEAQTGDSELCVYDAKFLCEGRPLMSHGDAVVAPTTRGNTWRAPEGSLGELAANIDPQTRAYLAELWAHDAQSEHASVASFARASMELMAVGAPPDLVAACHTAALDEVRHAEQSYQMASHYAGTPLSPGALRLPEVRSATLVDVAVNTFIEGCVGESIAALVVTRGASTCAFPKLKSKLARIAEDEGNLAALAWRTVAWALQTGRPGIADALRAAAAELRPDKPGTARSASHEELAAHGRLSPAQTERAVYHAWVHIIDPTLAQLLGK